MFFENDNFRVISIHPLLPITTITSPLANSNLMLVTPKNKTVKGCATGVEIFACKNTTPLPLYRLGSYR